jgi:hypothetical protein
MRRSGVQQFTCVDIEAAGRGSQAATAEGRRRTRTQEIRRRIRAREHVDRSSCARGRNGGRKRLLLAKMARGSSTRREERNHRRLHFLDALDDLLHKKVLVLGQGPAQATESGERSASMSRAVVTWVQPAFLYHNLVPDLHRASEWIVCVCVCVCVCICMSSCVLRGCCSPPPAPPPSHHARIIGCA